MNEQQTNHLSDKHTKELQELLTRSLHVCQNHFGEEYSYSSHEAVEELGLDDELIEQLVEDYITQILKDIIEFEILIYKLQALKASSKELDFVALRELAHKNLGVARNLRIKDAIVLLGELMKKDDLDYLLECIKTLHACAVRLKPSYALKTIKLLEVKSSF